ncbi:2-hydroxyacid dehydrogenase [Lacisediminimonas profundi]|uniref:2-hydroxyacid dehydrogenase n=1 Tax=Lacisediminimonas profundi TaxID=2603856 RepID=UPI00124B1053|nr:glyoxylate/hydroxypyruvate reductase A [Lacisediminimonas profundi]
MKILFYAPEGRPEPWLSELQSHLPDAQLRVWHEGDQEPADYAVVWHPPLALLNHPGLKTVFNLGAGVDAILRHGEQLPAGLDIVRLDDAGMGDQMAEYVSWAVLGYFRRMPDFARQQQQAQWRFLKPNDKRQFPVGILGMGVLGQRIAASLSHFGFQVNGWSRSAKSVPGVTSFVGDEQLDAFLGASRALVCILPLTPATEGILNRANLEKLPAGSYVINVARGQHVDEDALLALVQNGHIAGATLDVFRTEPLPPGHPFWSEPRITVTPHIAAVTLRQVSLEQIAGKIRKLENGEPIAGLVDRTKGY